MEDLSFYPLAHEEYMNLRNNLKPSEIDIYLYLVSKYPPSNEEMKINTSLIYKELGYHPRTVQSAIKKLTDMNAIKITSSKSVRFGITPVQSENFGGN